MSSFLGVAEPPLLPPVRVRPLATRRRASVCKSLYLRTQLLRILRKARVEPWPRLFQNLRATRETDLASAFPLHVVTNWLGNTPRVADKHYLQVTPEHYAQAVAQGGVNRGAVVARMGVPQAAAPDRRQLHQTKRAPGLNTPNGVFPEASKTVEAPRKEPSS